MIEVHQHGDEELCEAGLRLYSEALREGRLPARKADDAPCLIAFRLLQPTVEDLEWLEPVPPTVALHRLLRAAEERIATERRREEQLAVAFEPLMRLDIPQPTAESSGISVISGFDQIGLTIAQAMAASSRELLAIQPYYGHQTTSSHMAESLQRDQALLDQGGRIRTIYQHTRRHSPAIIARCEQLTGDVKIRTLDEVPERLLVIDRTVAFIPASKDRTLALEIRHPALITYLVTNFDRLWRLATPMYPEAVQQPTLNGVTPRQRAIANLLVEGHTDAVIADRLGLNIRTARVHIAKLAATLGSESRAQLGYLIGQSGILDQEG